MQWIRGIATSLLLLVAIPIQVQARAMDAQNVAVGDWSVKIRCGTYFYNSVLFPAIDKNGSLSEHDASKLLSRPPLFAIPHEYPCQLTLFPNSTFCLRPISSEAISSSQQFTNHDRLFLRGRWRVDPNPYCITDRFYDRLYLKSYPRRLVPRRQRQRQQTATKITTDQVSFGKHPLAFFKQRVIRSDSRNAADTSPRLSLNCYCRLCGRYASPGIWKSWPRRSRIQKTRARMTHGLLVWQPSKQRGSNKTKTTQEQKGRPWQLVGASFRGKRMVQRNLFSMYETEQELDMFGY